MAHAGFGWRMLSGNVGQHGLAILAGTQILRRAFLLGAADFPHQHHEFGLRVAAEHLQAVDETEAMQRIAADPHAGGLAEPGIGGLPDRFVGQCAGPGYDARPAAPENLPGHDADAAFVRGDDAGRVRTEETAFASIQPLADPGHVEHRNMFRDADDQGYFRIDRLQYRVRRPVLGNEDHAGIGIGVGTGRQHIVVDRQAEMRTAALAGAYARHHAGAE